MIRDENGLLTGYVFVDVADRPIGDYVADARRAMQTRLKLPAGASILWSGQYESAERVRQRLMVVVPVTIAIIFLLLYCNTRSLVKTMIVTLAVPFSAVGAIWIVYALGYNMSIAVWLGIIALLGIDAVTGVFMLLYLDLAYEKAKRDPGRMTRQRLYEAIVEGAAKRLRPKFMTFATMSIGLIPILWSTWHRIGDHEAHCGTHGRRNRDLVHSGTAGLSGGIPGLERGGFEKGIGRTGRQSDSSGNTSRPRACRTK
jgi:Cu(I)/Ag(I) efflux system membrane protein CusA/SilA